MSPASAPDPGETVVVTEVVHHVTVQAPHGSSLRISDYSESRRDVLVESVRVTVAADSSGVLLPERVQFSATGRRVGGAGTPVGPVRLVQGYGLGRLPEAVREQVAHALAGLVDDNGQIACRAKHKRPVEQVLRHPGG